MRIRARVWVGLMALGAFATVGLAEESSPAEPLAAFERFVGGAWQSEGDFKVRIVYEWGLNKKLLKIKSYLVGESGPQLVYESSVYWHPVKKQVVFQSVSSRGGLFDGTMSVDKNVYKSEFASYDGENTAHYRQSITFVDDDNVLWSVQSKKGNDWVTLHEVPEHRVKDAEAK